MIQARDLQLSPSRAPGQRLPGRSRARISWAAAPDSRRASPAGSAGAPPQSSRRAGLDADPRRAVSRHTGIRLAESGAALRSASRGCRTEQLPSSPSVERTTGLQLQEPPLLAPTPPRRFHRAAPVVEAQARGLCWAWSGRDLHLSGIGHRHPSSVARGTRQHLGRRGQRRTAA